MLTLLIENDNVSTSKINGMGGAQSGHCAFPLAMGVFGGCDGGM